jgi:hypothetical protein
MKKSSIVESKSQIKTFKLVDYSGLLYFLLIAVVSIAFWLNIPITYDFSWFFVPLLYFVLYIPFYIIILAVSIIYLFLKKLKAGQIVLGKDKDVTVLGSLTLLLGYFIILFMFLLITSMGLPLFFGAVISISGLEVPLGMGFWGSLFFLLVSTDPWVLFSFVLIFLFHFPRLVWLFKFVSMTEDETKTLRKKTKSRFFGLESQKYTYLRPVISFFLALALGIMGPFIIPFVLTWVFWNYTSKKKNKPMENLPWSDSLLLLAVLFLSIFAMLWIVFTFRITVFSFVPFVIIYIFINIKYTLEDAGVKLEFISKKA